MLLLSPHKILTSPSFLAISACGRKDAGGKVINGAPQAGGLYSFNDGEGGFRVGKVLVADEIIFVQLFSERWTKRPSLVQAHKVSQPIWLAYTSQTIEGMQPVLLEAGSVTPEELEAYEDWKRSKRDVF